MKHSSGCEKQATGGEDMVPYRVGNVAKATNHAFGGCAWGIERSIFAFEWKTNGGGQYVKSL
jgi:hypothetical protein